MANEDFASFETVALAILNAQKWAVSTDAAGYPGSPQQTAR
jgi:hypothetical protein